MKLSFSTNGWQELSWADFVNTANDLGFSGIEIHNITDERFTGPDAPFNKQNSAATVHKLRENSLSIPCIDTFCNVADSKTAEEGFEEVATAIEIASRIRCPYVRIHAYSTGEEKAQEDSTVISLIGRLIDKAETDGVTLLIETVGLYADTSRLRDLLNIFACDALAALWDINHPYRDFGEEAETTITNLGAYIKHVHIKDSAIEGGELKYKLVGEGDLPIDSMLRALSSVNYDGYLSYECQPEKMEDFGIAEIVFPHFVNAVSVFDKKKNTEELLYSNRSKTGKFVWEKYKLINKTFSDVLDTMVDKFPDQLAFKYTTLDYTRTYSEFRDDVDTFARSLIALGVKPGDKVAIWATNIPQWFITFWATTKIGAVLVTVNTAYKIHEIEYLLRQSDTHTLVTIESCLDSNYAESIAQLCPELEVATPGQPLHCRKLPFLRNVITVGYRQKGCLTWEEAVDMSVRIPIEEVYRRAAAVDCHDVANMQYTSGTTGFPKGVMLTHYNIVNNGKIIGDRMDISTADRMMIQVPMFHCFGMVLSMTNLMTHGGTICPLPYFSAKSSLACVNQEHITCFNGVPTMFIAMFQHEDFAKTDFSYMRTGIMAGANCPPDLMKKAAAEMNMTEILSVYGQTEASPGCTMGEVNESLEDRTETVGSAFPNVECKIIDPETGEDLPDGENGEFVARGYNIMKGYYKMPKATEAAIDADGWLHSGDIACRRPDGYYLITGRLKDMIIRGGENIYPREIEEFIFTHEDVQDVQVIGVPDKRYGEEIMACIILKEGKTMTEEQMKDYILSHMARHKVPRYIEFVKDFPKNAAGKILKYKMREEAAAKYGTK
ncbi:MAG: AMP-binding protein [Clostridia bacterium]|nr:AMP-binding protein [Clostridia bacterium]